MAGLDRRDAAGEGPKAEVAGAVGAVLWVAAILGWWLSQPEGQGPGLLVAVLLIVVPLALIAGLVSTLRTLREVRAETARLHDALDAARAASTAVPVRPAPPSEPMHPAPAEHQSSLELEDASDDGAELTIEDFLRALNFPDSADDVEGIEALQRVLNDHEAARLLRAAQDVLTLLAQDGIIMDDLVPEPPRPDQWRRFAAGERGAATAGVGAIRDRAALTATATRMREDAVFRDAAHHFMRTFDRSLPAFGEFATDTELEILAETRSARAFMLLARAGGAFD
ncbi:hypothetical protein [Falsirhodobacter deserti]|uniref:hypothetical protein n=1 Tax=Falsirhodobacter deserti TaxID=1365611 RepID=UPI000FE3D2DC|nr:hypothetical protein [Falsirhodobacter deserti]